MSFTIKVNGTSHSVDVDGDTPLLWVLRDVLGMTGTKFGCGMALCGACTVHVDGAAARSCITTIDSIGGRFRRIEDVRQRPVPGLLVFQAVALRLGLRLDQPLPIGMLHGVRHKVICGRRSWLAWRVNLMRLGGRAGLRPDSPFRRSNGRPSLINPKARSKPAQDAGPAPRARGGRPRALPVRRNTVQSPSGRAPIRE